MAKSALLLLTCMMISDWANVLLKLGVNKTEVGFTADKIWALMTNPWLIGGFALYASGMVFWLIVLEKHEFGAIMAFFSLHYVHLMLLARFVFNEPIKWNMWLGTLFIVMGVGLFNLTDILAADR